MTLPQPSLETLLYGHARLRQLLTALSRELDLSTAQLRGTHDAAFSRLLLERLRQLDIAHHVRECHTLFACIRQRCPPLAPVLLRMEGEHAQMEPMFFELVAALCADASPVPPDHSSLADRAKCFVDIMLGHLGVEENYILPVASDFLTAQDRADIAAAHGHTL